MLQGRIEYLSAYLERAEVIFSEQLEEITTCQHFMVSARG